MVECARPSPLQGNLSSIVFEPRQLQLPEERAPHVLINSHGHDHNGTSGRHHAPSGAARKLSASDTSASRALQLTEQLLDELILSSARPSIAWAANLVTALDRVPKHVSASAQQCVADAAAHVEPAHLLEHCDALEKNLRQRIV